VLLMSDIISNTIKNVLEVLPTRKKELWTYGNYTKRISSTEGYKNCHEVLDNWNYKYSWHLFRHWATLKFILDIGGGVIADVGCGYGELTKMINHSLRDLRNKVHYIGIDIVRDRLLDCENYKLNFDHIFLQFDISEGNLPFKKDSLDAIVCTEVLEHVDKEAGERLLERCFYSLKDGGRLFISTPFAPVGKHKKLRAYHIYMRTYSELRYMVSEIGFTVVAETGFEPKGRLDSLIENFPEFTGLSFLPDQISKTIIGMMLPIHNSNGWMAICEKKEIKGWVLRWIINSCNLIF